MYVKDATARVKAAGDADGLDEGQFDALVSVFNTVDSVGDVVMPGAFTDTLKAWSDSGDQIPVIWSHDWMDPYSHLGTVLSAEETEQGLQVRGQLDLNNPKAEQVYRLLKGRRVTQFSFAYDILDAAPVAKDGNEVFELRKLSVHEVGPTLLGANQDTELLAAKAHTVARQAKAGRVLSGKNFQALQKAYDQIGDVLAAAETTGSDESDDEEKTGQAPEAASSSSPETAEPAKSRISPAQVLASRRITTITEEA